MKVEKSPEAIQKENRILELEQQIRRTNITLKALKTRLDKTQTRIVALQRNLFNRMDRQREQYLLLSGRIRSLAAKLSKDRRFSGDERACFQEILDNFIEDPEQLFPPQAFQPDSDAGHDEADKARFQDAFAAFREEPPQAEQQDIRKLYIDLSKRFHPDRARGEKERARFHDLQQQLNKAYQGHDYQALIALEKENFSLKDEPDNRSSDALDLKIVRLEEQLRMLQQQQSRLSSEIKQLRKSEMGELLTHADSLERMGYDAEEQIISSPIASMMELMEKLQQELEQSDRNGKVSPMIYGFVQEVPADVLSILDQLLHQDFDLDFDDDPFSWEDEEEYNVNPDPDFAPGAAVRIVQDCDLLYHDGKGEQSFNARGLSGVVTDAILTEEGDPVYHIRLDTVSLKSIPKAFIQWHREDFHCLFYLKPEMLVAANAGRRESERVVQKAYRELLYRHLLSDLPSDQQQRLRKILLAAPAESDELNWLACFEDQLPLPFWATTRGVYSPLKAGRKAKIINYGGYSEEFGIMVFAESGKELIHAPLAAFRVPQSAMFAQLLEDYLTWMERYYF